MAVIDQATQDIYVEEAGSLNAHVWRESSTSCGDDIESLRSFAASGLIELDESRGQIEIRGRDKVGTLLLPSGRRIVLGTKISGLNLLEWLVFIGDFPEFTAWTRQQAVEAGNRFQKCLCELFLNELDIVTRVHLRKGYRSLDVESSLMRGRLQVSRLSQKPWRLPRLPQKVRTRTLDVDFNIVLALALDKIAPHRTDLSFEYKKRFAHLRDVWSGLTRSASDLVSLVNSVHMEPPHGYRRALQIARLLLLGATLDPHHGTGGRVFTISLANVWESGLEKMFIELQQETGWRVIRGDGKIRHWADSTGQTGSNRWMLADLVIERGGERAVLDAKYKCDFGDESRNDRFQMCAYAVAFDADKVTLVYPQESVAGLRKLLDVDFGNRHVSVNSITLSMNQGPEFCKSRIREFASSLLS